MKSPLHEWIFEDLRETFADINRQPVVEADQKMGELGFIQDVWDRRFKDKFIDYDELKREAAEDFNPFAPDRDPSTARFAKETLERALLRRGYNILETRKV